VAEPAVSRGPHARRRKRREREVPSTGNRSTKSWKRTCWAPALAAAWKSGGAHFSCHPRVGFQSRIL